MTVNEHGISIQDVENVLKVEDGDGYATLSILKTTEWYTLNG